MRILSSVDDLAETCDVAIIGGGPGGLAAATTAAESGLSVVLIDENDALGGQIYRGISTVPASRLEILGADYAKGRALVDAFAAAGADYMPGTTVWMASPELKLGISREGAARIVAARRIIIATGALERPMPIPGWTLPGVMTAGAAQGLLKASGMVPEAPFVLAGTGPLLWLLASQLLSAGARPTAILETSSRKQLLAAATDLPAFLTSPYLAKGLGLMRQVAASIRVISGVTALAAEGETWLSRLRFRRGTRAWETLPAQGLFLHQGVVPNINLARAAGCSLQWDSSQACFVPVADEWGRSSLEGVALAGDGAGIMGAEIAAARGHLCGLDAAHLLGVMTVEERQRRAEPWQQTIRRYGRGRRFLDTAFKAPDEFRVAEGETIVCRCESVTASQIKTALGPLGDAGPNQLKTMLRCGMGPCQGRLCGLTVTEMIARERQVSPQDVGYYRLRPPVKPITLGELASLPHDTADVLAVVRE
ncbi:NADPH-dependent 2,4-dienoyl-CoA reductase/sulfur reductase-like enzyme [Rhodoligotrophos appendicifer]|uniref:FAD/NAD(P)-dependent oxidoreductase n=1 Tax=Rhodoligotrophos appendicifer TaxID=987056 RepID=UPI001185B282|nr:NAD(P)/FAD-dependent oxidoreductase [Rhodoligotrophos appendicifer]